MLKICPAVRRIACPLLIFAACYFCVVDAGYPMRPSPPGGKGWGKGRDGQDFGCLLCKLSKGMSCVNVRSSSDTMTY